MSVTAFILAIAMATASDAAPQDLLFEGVTDAPRIAGVPARTCPRIRVVKPSERDKKDMFTCVTMPAEGFEATADKYAAGLAAHGWRRVKRIAPTVQLVALQKRVAPGVCRQLWLTVAPKIAPRGVDLATLPEQLNFELHEAIACSSAEGAS